VAPSDKVNVAIVGAGGQGLQNTRALFQEPDCQVIAIADPAEDWDMSAFYYGGRAGRGPVRAEIDQHYQAASPAFRCAVYEDFRVMLEKEKAIDAVLIATPDHLHAYAAILAMKAGKHVYCEKPLTHNVWEARAVARVAAETGVATQMGNQGRSSEGHRQTIEWIRDGAIGAVKEVHAWSGTAGPARPITRPEGAPEVPAGLNWDLWLGPRAVRSYHPAYAPSRWRGFWAFGGGTLPDMAVHNIDPAFNALELDTPETVEATATALDPELCSRGVFATWRFAARSPCTGTTAGCARPRRPRSIPRIRGSGWAKATTASCSSASAATSPARAGRACRACSRASGAASTSGRRRRCRASRATTPIGCRPARGEHRRAATSSTALASLSSCCSGAWPSGQARR
jgi:predicted dehydrogenase